MNDNVNTRRGRIQILLLALVFFGPLMLAIWMYYGDGRAGSDAGVNYGELLDPPITLDAKTHFDSGTRGRWTLLYLPSGDCDERCDRALIDMRQIRLATGREIDRIERAVVSSQPPAGLAELLAAQPGLLVISNETEHGAAINAAFGTLEREHIYILDPLGNLIMKYPSPPDRKGFLRDLKKLLKYSRIG